MKKQLQRLLLALALLLAPAIAQAQMLGAEDMLYHPRKTINVDACRGYFIIPEVAAASARQFVMGFDDGVITGIKTLNVKGDSQDNAPIYNLSGQRLSAPQKGVNIVNGKKILVK